MQKSFTVTEQGKSVSCRITVFSNKVAVAGTNVKGHRMKWTVTSFVELEEVKGLERIFTQENEVADNMQGIIDKLTEHAKFVIDRMLHKTGAERLKEEFGFTDN